MTHTTCAMNDANPTHEGHRLCAGCEHAMIHNLERIRDEAGPLLLIATKQAAVTHHDHTGHAKTIHPPTPIREDSWELHQHTERLLRLTATAVARPEARDPHATIPTLANAIITHPDKLFKTADAKNWHKDIADTAKRMHDILDPPPARVAFGACPHCDGVVWGRPDERNGRCARCETAVNRHDVGDRLLERLTAMGDVTGTAKQLSDICAKAGIRLPASTIRSWNKRGKTTTDANGFTTLESLIPLIKTRSTTP